MGVFISGWSTSTALGPYETLASMGSVVITPPAIEPLTLAEAKAQCRIDPANIVYDAKIRRYITQSRQYLELRTGRAFITQTLEATCDQLPVGRSLLLPTPPLISVTSITTYDQSDVASVMSPTDYRVDTDGVYGRIVLTTTASWPTSLRTSQAVKVRYVCGYGATAESVPEPIRGAIDLLVGLYHENHEAASIAPGSGAVDMPFGVEHVIATYRVPSL